MTTTRLVAPATNLSSRNVASLKRSIEARRLAASKFIKQAEAATSAAERTEAEDNADECLSQAETLLNTLKAQNTK